MNLVVDTSVIIAAITKEAHKKQLIQLTKGADLIAPHSLHWEVGNAFSAMFKRHRITLEQAAVAIEAYHLIPIRFADVELDLALQLAADLDIYAYDAYVIGCALKHRSPLVTLDSGLMNAARNAGANVREVQL